MEMAQAASTGPVHLDIRSVRQVIVHPEDEDRFMMTAKEAARACQQAQTEKDLREQFTQFLLYLREWCEKHTAEVRYAYAYPGDGFLNVLICTSGEGYRCEFDDAVTELDIALTQKFIWLAAEVMQAPESVRDGHISLEKAILVYVYGDAESSRPASKS
jgi:hypothetical protein